MVSQIFILKHFNSDIDNIKVFTNVDAALDVLREWLDCDSDLMNYGISKYELNNETSEFEHVDELELDELIDINDDDLSVIDSGSDDSD